MRAGLARSEILSEASVDDAEGGCLSFCSCSLIADYVIGIIRFKLPKLIVLMILMKSTMYAL